MPGRFVSSEGAAQLRASVGGCIDQSVTLDGGRKSNPGNGFNRGDLARNTAVADDQEETDEYVRRSKR
jgi:hypothetical protein